MAVHRNKHFATVSIPQSIRPILKQLTTDSKQTTTDYLEKLILREYELLQSKRND